MPLGLSSQMGQQILGDGNTAGPCRLNPWPKAPVTAKMQSGIRTPQEGLPQWGCNPCIPPAMCGGVGDLIQSCTQPVNKHRQHELGNLS